MLKATHILAAGLSCILLISEITTADPGPCPDFPNKTVNWNNILKNSFSKNIPFHLESSFFWDRKIKNDDGYEYRCRPKHVPPKPKNLNNYVQRVVGTDNNQFAVIMECNGNKNGHNMTIRTYTKEYSIYIQQPLIDAIKAVHVANGFALEYFKQCYVIFE